MTARPVVTMDDGETEDDWPVAHPALYVDGQHVGWIVYPQADGKPWFAQTLETPGTTAAQCRAIADFLEQLEGANLLSGISEAGE